jgi:hypothetical protein
MPPFFIAGKKGASAMSQPALQRITAPLDLLRNGVLILTALTALIHLRMGILFSITGEHRGAGPSFLAMLPVSLTTLFYLNFAAYAILGILLYLPALRAYRRVLRWLLIILAVLTIAVYFLVLGTRVFPLGYIDKGIEVLLIILLLIDDWRDARVRAHMGVERNDRLSYR